MALAPGATESRGSGTVPQGATMNHATLTARYDVQAIALREILSALAEPQRAAVAAGLRAGVAAMLAERGDTLWADADEAATAELAALLEAAGQPVRL